MPLTRLATALAVALLFFGLAACNTIEGAGEDLESAGEAVENTAEEASR